MANLMNISPLVVMQNMNVIHGKPSWSAQFITATIIGSGRFEDLDYEVSDIQIDGTLKYHEEAKNILWEYISKHDYEEIQKRLEELE